MVRNNAVASLSKYSMFVAVLDFNISAPIYSWINVPPPEIKAGVSAATNDSLR
jgi:hypothetical protein